MHDPYVKADDQNLEKYHQENNYTLDLNEALKDADYIIMCNSHKEYIDNLETIIKAPKALKGVVDACNIYDSEYFRKLGIPYTGIGRGTDEPTNDFISFVFDSFQSMENGLAVELNNLIKFYNSNYAFDEFNKVDFKDVQKLAKTCSTGCEIADAISVGVLQSYQGFSSRLVELAFTNK
jgi:hypothetical protein